METKLLKADGTPVHECRDKSEMWVTVRALLLRTLLVCCLCFGIGFMVGNNHKQQPGPVGPRGPQGLATYIPSPEAQDEWDKEQRRREREKKERDRIWMYKPALRAPADAPPPLIRIGPYFYTVGFTSEKALASQNALAASIPTLREIWLNPNRTANLRDDLVHELMHCARDVGTNVGWLSGPGGSEENIIKEMSPTFLQIMQQNPELMSWLSHVPQSASAVAGR